MFQQGEQVVYGVHGVCRILEIEQRVVNRVKTDYYVLSPLEQTETRFYIPVHNQLAVAKLRPMLTRQQLDELLRSDSAELSAWIADENQRKQRYRELIGSGDRAALISMVRSLHKHKADQIASGKKFHQCDENFLRDAERMLRSEFSLVLGIPQGEVAVYIKSIIESD
ncbi:MAG: hypothetical protein IJO45_05100 [Oscillospiraceae bacterium]|nr:hypothetical protein [Oscillospiraceae bacterium]